MGSTTSADKTQVVFRKTRIGVVIRQTDPHPRARKGEVFWNEFTGMWVYGRDGASTAHPEEEANKIAEREDWNVVGHE